MLVWSCGLKAIEGKSTFWLDGYECFPDKDSAAGERSRLLAEQSVEAVAPDVFPMSLESALETVKDKPLKMGGKMLQGEPLPMEPHAYFDVVRYKPL